ncbi:c-type cytochrome [Ningiella sp. W23]|uniref:c-type cytochrome n=1 Tax=Ningiella sp. W23 TaxID=3023715 RepID=UPI0037572CE5
MKKLLSSFALASIALSTVTFSTLSTATEVKTEKQAKAAVQFRQALLQLVRSNMGPLGAMAKGNIPYDAQVMIKNGQRMEQLGLMMEDYFTPNTTAFDVETGALDNIWSNQADFNQKAQNMVEAAANVQSVAQAGATDDYRKAIGALGATCKACHDDYKKD